MNWVGGARNRLKLKHENKLQKEFFEKKRQLKGNTRTPFPKRTDNTTAKASQDLFSLEVIMSAHKKDIKQKKGDRTRTSLISDDVNCEKPHLQLGGPSKQMQHILPELSPVRQLQQLPGAVNLQEGKHGNFCSDLDKRECIFSTMPSELRQTDDRETLSGRQVIMDDEEDLGPWEATFQLGAAAYTTK